MCRLYALRSNEETKVECTLVHSQNALLLQSRADLTGRTHADGWGIAFYQNSLPTVERQQSAAFHDLSFSRMAERVYSKTVIAHVRMATVGELRPENAHPFVFKRWTFAHNGTVQGFNVLGEQMRQETLPPLQATRCGDTDSEQLFLWLLSRLQRSRVSLEEGITDLEQAGDTIAASIAKLAGRCNAVDPSERPKLNIVLTDGRSMIVTRWDNSLHYLVRHGIGDCEICGIPHIHHEVGTDYRAVVVASEPISEEPWLEVPNKSMLCIDANARLVMSLIEDHRHHPKSELTGAES